MNEMQIYGAFLLTLVCLAPVALALPLFCRWGVETGGYRHLCFTRKGAERLADYARTEGQTAEVVQLV